MSTWLAPGGPAVQENADGADWLIPGASVINEASVAAAAPTAIFYGPLVGPLGGPI